jgi:hypothetical protein
VPGARRGVRDTADLDLSSCKSFHMIPAFFARLSARFQKLSAGLSHWKPIHCLVDEQRRSSFVKCCCAGDQKGKVFVD